ncbi:uncharacterized protein UBRO_03394 [Ustilago bromivora]|uniref:Uncharacterized protein n=1 Tax=Ustilago bromivora TaxID=307758 RepID=A0A1K0GRW1_9BASI|nr:uncharacterized protein UBRO_03394 [Ustilago bromivora]SYW82764.1 uncharacterized protein UBRO2_04886 [Ustilago bromivora]
MTARSLAAPKTPFVAASHAVSNGLGATVRPRRLAQPTLTLPHRSVSPERLYGKWADNYLNRKTRLVAKTQTVGRARGRALGKILHDAHFDTAIRMLAPETYSGAHREARNLDEALAGAADWVPTKLAHLASRPEKLRTALEQHLYIHNVRNDYWLSIRNAMLAESWLDARRHMINIDDAKWPGFVLQRAIRTVATPSDMSDSLAILNSTLQHASEQLHSVPSAYFKTLRYCVSTLIFKILKQDGSAVHLIPRLTDVLLRLIEVFPVLMRSSTLLFVDFTCCCTAVVDERARHAVSNLLDGLQSTSSDADSFRFIRQRIVSHCIDSIEVSMKKAGRKTASSEQFVNLDLMEKLLQQEFSSHANVKQRALRCAVHVAGHHRDDVRAWRWFNRLQQYNQNHNANTTISDYLVLAKALVRSKQGRNEAWRVFLEAEKYMPSHSTSATAAKQDLDSTCIELLEVMAMSTDVRLESVLSLLGVADPVKHEHDIASVKMANALSKTTRRPRVAVVAFTMVMQGCLARQRPEYGVLVWQTMRQRDLLPNVACLSVYLQNLFKMNKADEAMRQLHLWCEEGVPDIRNKLQEVSQATQISTGESSQQHDLPSAAPEVSRYRITPDPILASVVFRGLYTCGSVGIEALWDAYQQTIRLFPDAYILSLLLKVSCQDDRKSRINARFGWKVFRSLLFGKHPDLEEYRNPLKLLLETPGTAGWIFSDDTVGSKVENWFASVFRPQDIESPVAAGDSSGLVFTSKVLESYVRLILHLQHSPGQLADARFSREELVNVLGWMKELGLRPSTTHLALTILEIEENLLPAVATRQMEVLEGWLVDWLGEDALPTERQMQRHWQWKMKRNEQKKNWFDQIRMEGPHEPYAASIP